MSVEISKEKSQEQANIIIGIALNVMMLDLPYLKEAVKQMRDQASWQQSASVLNPNYNPKKDELLYAQANACQKLIDYVESLQEVDKLKGEVSTYESHREQLAKLFI